MFPREHFEVWALPCRIAITAHPECLSEVFKYSLWWNSTLADKVSQMGCSFIQIYMVFEALQSTFVGYHYKIKSLINYLIANLITLPGSHFCYAQCLALKWSDLRAPWADGRRGGLLRTSEKRFKGSGCAQTTLPPPMPFAKSAF